MQDLTPMTWMGERVTVGAPPVEETAAPKPEAATNAGINVAANPQPAPAQP